VGVSADHPGTLEAFTREHKVKHPLLSDFRRQMLTDYGALITDEKSPLFRYGKRAYFIVDKTGTVKFVKVLDNPLDLLNPDDVLKAVKASAS
jgi:peroxiredoxin